MVARQEDGQWYGDTQADIQEVLAAYSADNGYPAHHHARARCSCGATQFTLLTDEDDGVAVRICSSCSSEHKIGDSDEYYDEAEPVSHECLCGSQLFEITVAVSLYEGSEDIRWVYVGCRCPKCSLMGCYGDWKNEFNGYRAYLAKV